MVTVRSMVHVLAATAVVLDLGCNNPSLPSTSGVSSPRAGVDTSGPGVEKEPLITVTPDAVQSFTRICKESGFAEPWYLRVRLVPGGCCGFMHKLDLDTEVSLSSDDTFECAGVKIVVWKHQIEMLRGAKVDYGTKDDKRGFMVKNPNFEGEALKKWLPILNAEAQPTPKLNTAQLAEKISQFRKMTSEDSENELAHYRLGQLLMEDGQFANAAKSFERALDLAPQFIKMYRLIGECLVKLDQKEHAVLVLTKGWSAADQKGDEVVRKQISDLLSELGVAVPLGISRSGQNK